MAATIIDGFAIAQEVRADAANRTLKLAAQGIQPCLAVVLVGTDPASISYVTGKEKALTEAGMISKDIRLPADTDENQLLEIISELNTNPSVHGILVQLPLPHQLAADNILLARDPQQDVDGFPPVNVGKMMMGRRSYLQTARCFINKKRIQRNSHHLPYRNTKYRFLYKTGRYPNRSSRNP